MEKNKELLSRAAEPNPNGSVVSSDRTEEPQQIGTGADENTNKFIDYLLKEIEELKKEKKEILQNYRKLEKKYKNTKKEFDKTLFEIYGIYSEED